MLLYKANTLFDSFVIKCQADENRRENNPIKVQRTLLWRGNSGRNAYFERVHLEGTRTRISTQ